MRWLTLVNGSELRTFDYLHLTAGTQGGEFDKVCVCVLIQVLALSNFHAAEFGKSFTLMVYPFLLSLSLSLSLSLLSPPSFQGAIDDWVFMCFFVVDDFLSHLLSLEIRERAIDSLIRFCKQVVPQTHVCNKYRRAGNLQGYLTHNGKANLPRVQLILTGKELNTCYMYFSFC